MCAYMCVWSLKWIKCQLSDGSHNWVSISVSPRRPCAVEAVHVETWSSFCVQLFSGQPEPTATICENHETAVWGCQPDSRPPLYIIDPLWWEGQRSKSDSAATYLMSRNGLNCKCLQSCSVTDYLSIKPLICSLLRWRLCGFLATSL